LGLGAVACQLLLHTVRFAGLVAVVGKHGMPIMVHRLRAARGLHDLPQHLHIALLILLLTKDGSHHLAGCIINASHQGKARSALLQPLMWTGIDLEQLPFLSIPWTTQAMLGALGWLHHPHSRFVHYPADTRS
jgi:hypothetical protein